MKNIDALFDEADLLIRDIETELDQIRFSIDWLGADRLDIRPQSIIVCAACRINGVIFCGARHWDTRMRSQARRAGFKHVGGSEEGFIDQYGNFFDRYEAMNIVRRNGQPFNEERNGSNVKLYSEGLY